MASKKTQVGLIGAGNVAHHLGKRLVDCNVEIVQVFSRKITKARKLVRVLGQAEPINDLRRLDQRINIIILAVNDDAISQVAQQISKSHPDTLVVHTSGAMPSIILKPFFRNYGSFYPLQSFSIERELDFGLVPICIHSPQKRNRTKLLKLARRIVPNVYEVNDQQRNVLHVAAVFVNNFTNHMYHIAHDITDKASINFDILKPLLLETALKVQDHHPKDMQTGPARRKDQLTMNKHLNFLREHPDLKRLYELISEGIEKEF